MARGIQRRLLLPYITNETPQIIVGDFNCVEQLEDRLDPLPLEEHNGAADEHKLKTRDLQEWAMVRRHGDLEGFMRDGVMTLSHTSPPMPPRNDRAYTNGGVLEREAETWQVKALPTHAAAGLSDHTPIVIQ